jgi:flagellar basal-body rod protein FlgG
MRAMWTAASGMQALQLKVDTISNNLANVNTTGFKSQRIEFKDLLYEKVSENTFVEGEGKPVPLEIGHGVMPVATLRSFGQGNMQATENKLDFAINGDGFFVVQDNRGNDIYTRDGSFKLSVDGANSYLTTSDGFFVQGADGNIELGENVKKIEVDYDGNILVTRAGEEESENVGTLRLVKFPNPAGLESVGKNFYVSTQASGELSENENGSNGEIWQGYVESSNVSVVEEMVNLITAQRAYEINSKSVETADSMLQVANNLKR